MLDYISDLLDCYPFLIPFVGILFICIAVVCVLATCKFCMKYILRK